MRIKNVVKVMNFHALLRVDSAKKKAEKYFGYEKELYNFADIILNNRNFVLDKKVLKTNKRKKALNIYIANDMGFCGNFNSNVNKLMQKDSASQKIVIGKKVLKKGKNVLLEMTKEEYDANTKSIEEILYKSIRNNLNSEINIIYNHYYNISQIELVKKKILPIDYAHQEEKQSYKSDFVIEGDINNILVNIIVLYLCYEIKVAQENSYASENVMRQTITKQSLDKIAEFEEEDIRQNRKIRKQKSFKKTLENFIKNMAKEKK